MSETSHLISFGEIVRKRRNERRWSQEELASHCDLDRTYVSGVERGTRNIGLLNILRIADALDVRASTLLEFHLPRGGKS
ncbi:helix-turn-helix domain-containing protein [Verrucomicrobiales bacterium]|nr:helix-turn-helix domain-containing protein [Verrucomicrobiales bacterium]